MSNNRAPFQILVLPFRVIEKGRIEYCIFRRTKDTGDYWQAIAGGGEGKETALDAAKRESFEEAAITPDREYIELKSLTTIPVEFVCGFRWGANVLVIPEYTFGVDAQGIECKLSDEHSEYRWCDYKEAARLLKFDSNRTALWELNLRLERRLASG